MREERRGEREEKGEEKGEKRRGGERREEERREGERREEARRGEEERRREERRGEERVRERRVGKGREGKGAHCFSHLDSGMERRIKMTERDSGILGIAWWGRGQFSMAVVGGVKMASAVCSHRDGNQRHWPRRTEAFITGECIMQEIYVAKRVY